MQPYELERRKVLLFLVSLLAMGAALRWAQSQWPAAAVTRMPAVPAALQPSAAQLPKPAAPAERHAPISINAADVAELKKIPGVGPVIAQRIAAYRQEHGRFQSAADILKVKGIGAKKYERMKDFICVE
ncbi:MAG: helix-hairpin-helix domain-containing protein [Candidatus Omnitrophica bacterium]|nr:helix-hairpin-helix domain-containing protein [Candidatus Omnitrophota bacterium]